MSKRITSPLSNLAAETRILLPTQSGVGVRVAVEFGGSVKVGVGVA